MKIKRGAIREERLLRTQKMLVVTTLFLITCYRVDSLLAAPGAMARTETDFSSNISVVIGGSKWRVGNTVINKPDSLDQKGLNILANENIKSVEDYAEWLRKNLKYRRDKKADRWSLPEETLRKGCGDCEDLAFLSEEVLSILGYKPQVVALAKNGRKEWYAICIFKRDGHYLYFDNCRFKKTSATSLEQFTKYIRAESDMIILDDNNMVDILQEAISLDGMARGARIEKKNGEVRIIASEQLCLQGGVRDDDR